MEIVKKHLKEFWLWMPGLYRIMMCFTPVIFVLMTWMYLEDGRNFLSAVLNGFGLALFWPVGVILIWTMLSIVSFMANFIFSLPSVLIGLIFGKKRSDDADENENTDQSHSHANVRKFDEDADL